MVCKDYYSDWSNVLSGVPQGSILGPLLFLLYVNDISNDLTSITRLFADDCAIFREIGSNADCISLQNDLSKLHRWTQKWQLPLNTSKCKVMCISNKRCPLHYSYSVNNIALEWVDTFSYLGIKIDRKLKWGDHIAGITLKASKLLGLLRRSLKGCSNRAKKRAYSALVRPRLEFCAPVWNPHQRGQEEALEQVQRRAARWICARWDPVANSWSKSYPEALMELEWHSLKQRRYFSSCCQVFKIINNLDCISFCTYFNFARTITRSHSLSLLCKRSRVNSFRYSFFINASFLWNKLPFDVASASSYNSFKRKLKADLACI